jgi:hypothetical protein
MTELLRMSLWLPIHRYEYGAGPNVSLRRWKRKRERGSVCFRKTVQEDAAAFFSGGLRFVGERPDLAVIRASVDARFAYETALWFIAFKSGLY